GCLVILNNGSGNKSMKAAWWIILYVPGMLAGMAGLMSSGDHSGLYWSYFFAKRLTMFSW
ncbi:hypothetical protein BD779DRAFT_1507640, partial [Infundibulicybe gibba]